MSDHNLPIKDVIAASNPLIKSIIDTFISPKLERFKKRINIDFKTYCIPTEEHFSEYFHRTYKRLSSVSTLVFNNRQWSLKEIYIPLTIKDGGNQTPHRIITFPEKLFSRYEKILVTDAAGMGKTTLMKKLFIDIIDKNLGIPIFIELRRLSREKTLILEIKEQLNALSKEFDSELLLKLIEEGGFIFILDGYDEIPLIDKAAATQDIENFISRASKNKFLFTSRPEGALRGFGNFQSFSIEPLKEKEAYELLRKYDTSGTVSELLINKLSEENMVSISEYLTNPLLVSLLFTAFDHKQTIPFKKHLFYRQVYDANFESHDLTKGNSFIHKKYSNLETDDFHRVLRHIGFSCLRRQKIEFTKDDLLNLIKSSRNFCFGLEFNDSGYLNDLLITVPLFCQDGTYYRWAHKSLQEYFATQFIYIDSKDQQKKIIEKIYHHKEIAKFYNVLDLYYDVDFKTFRNVIIYNLLLDYNEHLENNYSQHNLISQNDINERKEECFFSQHFLFSIPENEKEEKFSNQYSIMIDSSFRNAKIATSKLITNHKIYKNVYCVKARDPKYMLLKLLFDKNFRLVDRDESREEKITSVNFLRDYDLHEIKDDTNSEFNKKECFSKTTDMLKYAIGDAFKINKKMADQLFKEIKESLKSEEKGEHLLSDF